MKTTLFDEHDLTPKQLLENLEGSNCGVEESHKFIKPFTEEELINTESAYLEDSKKLFQFQKELEATVAPLKEKIDPLKKQTQKQIKLINQGGEEVIEKVYCFPDYESKVMGLYDSRGILVGTRPMSRAERQLHINSHLNINKAV
jgi:hypothetical protein